MFEDFINEYFIIPFKTDSGYNFVNSIVYALIALLLLYIIFRGLQKLKVNIDRKFFYAILPFIFFGSSLRAFVDHKIIGYYFWTVSPGIWLFVTSIFLICFAVSWLLYKNQYWKICAGAGIILSVAVWLFNIGKLEFTNALVGAAIIGLAFGISALLYFAFKSSKAKWFLGVGFFPFIAHMLDASATFIAVDFYGAIEKHPLTKMVNEFAGTAAILFLLKLLILLPAVYLIQTEIKDRNLRNYLLIAIAVLGLSEGLRDLITLII